MTARPNLQNGRVGDPSLPRGTGETILVVEDDPSLRRLAGLQLRSLGYTVIDAGDSAAALELVEREREIKLMLTDIVMPGALNGAELALAAQTLRPDLKVMYMSGFPRVGPDTRPENDVPLLCKPFRLKEMAVSVTKVLQGQQTAVREK